MRRTHRRLYRRLTLLMLSILLAGVGTYQLWSQRGRLKWESTTAVISRFNDGRDWTKRRGRWTPGIIALIRYKYQVENSTYESEEVLLVNHDRKDPQSTILVYYNPENPQETGLAKDLSIWSIALVISGATATVYNAIRLRKRLRNMGHISAAAGGRRS